MKKNKKSNNMDNALRTLHIRDKQVFIEPLPLPLDFATCLGVCEELKLDKLDVDI